MYTRENILIFPKCAGAKLVTTITNDGMIVFKEYAPGSRKVESVYKGKCTIPAYRLLCSQLEDCITTADRQDAYCDDASEELKIYHPFGRVQIMDRGLGNEETHIGEIMHEFFERNVIEEYAQAQQCKFTTKEWLIDCLAHYTKERSTRYMDTH